MQKSTERAKKVRDAYRAAGFERLEVWCKPSHKEQIKRFAKKLTGGEK